MAPAALLAAACAGAGDAPDETPPGRLGQAIEGGADEPGHREIVRLIRLSGDEGSKCTGVIVAPDLVLTARHCVSPFEEPDDACGRNQRAEGTLTVQLRGEDEKLIELQAQEDSIRVPRNEGASSCDADIALVYVPAMIAYRNEPWFRAASPRLDRAPEPGEPYVALGFGALNAEGVESGGLRVRQNLSVACLYGGCDSAEDVKPSEWQGEAGVCRGDSGGPALDAQGRVLGVASRSKLADCTKPTYSSAFDYRAWLQREALAAARLGGYDDPPWARRVAELTADTSSDEEGGCAFGPARPGGRGGFALAAAALGCAALGARRRSRRSAG